ncbi:MAG TPA: DUF5686 family protein [Puia sp.]|nr:DUF5686 family protein [Puia sp.]
MPIKRLVTISLLYILWLCPAAAQSRVVTGLVLDSLTRLPLPNVSVTLAGTGKGSLTDAKGRFHIVLGSRLHEIRVSASGYAPVTVRVSDSTTSPLTILLSVSYTALQQVVIHKRTRYRNKHNPAVELIRQVIAHKEENAPAFYPFMTYEQYDKIRVLADRPPHFITEGKLFKRYRFLFTPDTTLVPGKSLVPAYLEETLSRNYSRTSPPGKKQVILGHKRVDLGEYIDMSGVSAIINRLYQDFSVYDNTMLVFTLQFMSPVAKLAPDLYEYFIRDTVVEQGVRLVRLNFIPRNPQDLLFKGTLYITLDGSYAIRRAEMEAPNKSNLNWVRSFSITQTFDKGPGGRYYRSLSDMLSYFSLVRNHGGFYGERSVAVSRVSDSILPATVFHGLPVDTALLSVPQPDSFWVSNRPVPLSLSESRTYANTDSLVKMPSYRRLMDFITFLTAGYKSAGKFDIGPVGNFYSFNSLEGSRYQFGGRSNVKLSTRIFTDDYIAYGAGDRRWKYSASATYSINHKSIYTYPFHYIQGSFLHDVRNPGAENEFTQDNTFLGSFNRGIGGKWLYTDIANLSYVHEFGDHLSYNLGARYWLQQPAQSLYYIYEPQPGLPDTVSRLTTTQLSVTLGWAPHEQFYQGRNFRRIITTQYPVFSFQYALGIKGPLGGQYNYNAFHLTISKRWYLAPLGYSDIRFTTGYITGNLPFPLLTIHPANPAFFYSFGSYNLMDVEEFVSDHYAGVNVDHYFNGFFFNKIPLLKKLRLREVIEGKILFGGVRQENNPALNPGQMKFPLNNAGMLTTYTLGNQPYLEAGVGIYNIFNILRIDVIRRFTYLNHPGVPSMGIRLSTGLNF